MTTESNIKEISTTFKGRTETPVTVTRWEKTGPLKRGNIGGQVEDKAPAKPRAIMPSHM